MVRLGDAGTPVRPLVREALVNASEILVTPIARAEIGIKLSIGKLRLPVDEDLFWRTAVLRLQATELPFESSHAAHLVSLPLLHKDPFDRMIAAQCLEEGVYLATTDEIFARYGVPVII